MPVLRGGIGAMLPGVGMPVLFSREMAVIGFWAEFPLHDAVILDCEHEIIPRSSKMG